MSNSNVNKRSTSVTGQLQQILSREKETLVFCRDQQATFHVLGTLLTKTQFRSLGSLRRKCHCYQSFELLC